MYQPFAAGLTLCWRDEVASCSSTILTVERHSRKLSSKRHCGRLGAAAPRCRRTSAPPRLSSGEAQSRGLISDDFNEVTRARDERDAIYRITGNADTGNGSRRPTAANPFGICCHIRPHYRPREKWYALPKMRQSTRHRYVSHYTIATWNDSGPVSAMTSKLVLSFVGTSAPAGSFLAHTT